MPNSLDSNQLDRFQRDGFLPRLPAFSEEEAGRCRASLEAFEARQGAPITELDIRNAYKLHLLFGWANDIVRHPAVLDAVEGVIGPDILVYTSKFFIKEPGSAAITVWHQDATHFGFAAAESVAAWVAFSDAPLEAGCLEYLAGSHRLGQLQHRSQAHPDSISGGAQSIVEAFDQRSPVAAPVRAGEFTMHHSLCVHRSRRNTTADRRIGLSIHYVAPHVAHLGSRRLTTMLVRGEDRHGHYDPVPPPVADFDAAAQRVHGDAVDRYRANYAEQEARHGAGPAPESSP